MAVIVFMEDVKNVKILKCNACTIVFLKTVFEYTVLSVNKEICTYMALNFMQTKNPTGSHSVHLYTKVLFLVPRGKSLLELWVTTFLPD